MAFQFLNAVAMSCEDWVARDFELRVISHPYSSSNHDELVVVWPFWFRSWTVGSINPHHYGSLICKECYKLPWPSAICLDMNKDILRETVLAWISSCNAERMPLKVPSLWTVDEQNLTASHPYCLHHKQLDQLTMLSIGTFLFTGATYYIPPKKLWFPCCRLTVCTMIMASFPELNTWALGVSDCSKKIGIWAMCLPLTIHFQATTIWSRGEWKKHVLGFTTSMQGNGCIWGARLARHHFGYQLEHKLQLDSPCWTWSWG